MDNQLWKDHLLAWKHFLIKRINLTDDDGERIKCERQIRTIERVRCGAVLNPSLLLDFIVPSEEEIETSSCKDYYLQLNNSQRAAVNSALGDTDLSLIQGPPGTGKTQVIAEICLQLVKKNPEVRILVCSETHVAVNNLLSRIANFADRIRIVRVRDKEHDDTIDCFSPENIINNYLAWASNSFQSKDAYSIVEGELRAGLGDDTRKRSQLERSLALSANITGMTCNRVAAYEFKNTTEMFDVAIIDEVCKATLPEILAPMIVSRKAILIGDPKQLPPVFCSEEQDIIKDIEECNLDRFMYIDALFNNSINVHILDTQYRMSEQISNMISDMFYDGTLKNGRIENLNQCLVWLTYRPTTQWPICKESAEKPDIYNEDEGKIIKDLLQIIVDEEGPDVSVAVIAPYRAQIEMLRQRCGTQENITIDTVDKFQGKERDIVIFSLTRTIGSYRFLADSRRLNVALSRARNKIYIVGNKDYAERQPLLRGIMNRCRVEESALQA